MNRCLEEESRNAKKVKIETELQELSLSDSASARVVKKGKGVQGRRKSPKRRTNVFIERSHSCSPIGIDVEVQMDKYINEHFDRMPLEQHPVPLSPNKQRQICRMVKEAPARLSNLNEETADGE